jgi:hypothetical protein
MAVQMAGYQRSSRLADAAVQEAVGARDAALERERRCRAELGGLAQVGACVVLCGAAVLSVSSLGGEAGHSRSCLGDGGVGECGGKRRQGRLRHRPWVAGPLPRYWGDDVVAVGCAYAFGVRCGGQEHAAALAKADEWCGEKAREAQEAAVAAEEQIAAAQSATTQARAEQAAAEAKSAGLERGLAELAESRAVSRAFPSCRRSILTEIYLCHACSCQEIEDGNARAGDGGGGIGHRS